jgi:hypothetical protein
MKASFSLLGAEEISAQFADLRSNKIKQLMRVTLGAGLNAIGQQMKQELDPKVAEAGRHVGTRITIWGTRITRAKVGFGVGKRKNKTTWRRKRSGPGGVGISGRNVHWWILGTQKRYRGGLMRKRIKEAREQSPTTGIMPAMQPNLAQTAYSKVSGKLLTIMTRAGRKYLDAMARREKKKALSPKTTK